MTNIQQEKYETINCCSSLNFCISHNAIPHTFKSKADALICNRASSRNWNWYHWQFHLATRSLHQYTKITTYTKFYQENEGSRYHHNVGNNLACVDLTQDVLASKLHKSSQLDINLHIQFQWLLNPFILISKNRISVGNSNVPCHTVQRNSWCRRPTVQVPNHQQISCHVVPLPFLDPLFCC